VTYTIESELNVYITFDVSTHTIVIYSEEMDLLVSGSFSYTISVHIAAYPECACTDCCASSSALIVIGNPCTDCVMSSGVPESIAIPYGQSGEFNYPALSVSPAGCAELVTYTCEYLNGPYEGQMNMCSFALNHQGHTCSAVFDTTTGQYTFTCTDMATFRPGQYTFRITAHIGAKSTSVRFTMSLIDTCPTVAPEIFNSPFAGTYQYVLRDEATKIGYDLSSVGSITADLICGQPSIQFITSMGSVTLNDVFKPDYVNSVLSIGYSQDFQAAATYKLKFRYFNSVYPERYVQSEEFIVKVIDACNPPTWYEPKMTMTAPVLDPLEYIVGQDV
jgi:hypothetical protein